MGLLDAPCLKAVHARLTVSSDGAISTVTALPAGEHAATVTIQDRPARQLSVLPFDIDALSTIDLGPWPEGVSLRREDMYGIT